jgi:zinc transport system ATP-binding protein
MSLIEFKDVSFGYGNQTTLEEISFAIKPGEFVGIIGPNGGGKTTLMKLIMGLYQPFKGSIVIESKSPYFFRQKIGYVPQLTHFDPEFPITTLELVLMGCANLLTPFGTYPKEAYEKAKEALKKVGLSNLESHPFGKLSGGQARRALIARAIAGSPKLLLLDEPTANIDETAEKAIADLILSLRSQMTILMVTHEIPGVISHVDRVFCIQKTLTEISRANICNHYNMGIYHNPKLSKKEEA